MATEKPAIFTTAKTTDTSSTSLAVGCPVGTTTAVANSGMKVATISIESLAAPTITTNKLYNISGALTWNGVTVATGSTVSGTAGTIGKFTGVAAMGDSLLTESGSTVTMAGTFAATTFSGSGASLTSIPTSAVSSGSYVATVGSGTGITSSVTTGNAAATTITLNNTAVTPAAYPFFTVDQQGRLTAASRTYSVSTTSDFSVSILQTNTTAGVSYGPLIRGGTNASDYGLLVQNAATNVNLLIVAGNGDVTAGAKVIATTALEVGTTSKLTGNVSVGGANVTDGTGTPTLVSTNFGSGATIAGKSYGFVITCGTGPNNGGTVNFNTTYASVPSVTVSTSGLATGGSSAFIYVTATTTQATFYSYTVAGTLVVMGDGQVLDVHVRGF